MGRSGSSAWSRIILLDGNGRFDPVDRHFEARVLMGLDQDLGSEGCRERWRGMGDRKAGCQSWS